MVVILRRDTGGYVSLSSDAEIRGDTTSRTQRHPPEWAGFRKPAIILGCGGVGYWVAYFEALLGNQYLCLIDGDTIGAENRNRLPVPPSAIGVSKAHFLGAQLLEAFPSSKIQTIHEMITPEGIMSILRPFRCDIGCTLYDTVDSPEMHEAVANYKWPTYLRVVRASYDGISHITIATRKVATWGEATGRYEVTPSVVLPAVITAALAIYAGEEQRKGSIPWPIASIFTSAGMREFKLGGVTNGMGK